MRHSKVEQIEPTNDLDYPYQVYVAYNPKFDDDATKAAEIISYLKQNQIDGVLDNNDFLPGLSWVQKLLTAVKQCRWFIFLLTKNALKDESLTFNVLSALTDGICKKKVRVIPVVDRNRVLRIPESLRWITYIPFDDTGRGDHLKSLYNIVSGRFYYSIVEIN